MRDKPTQKAELPMDFFPVLMDEWKPHGFKQSTHRLALEAHDVMKTKPHQVELVSHECCDGRREGNTLETEPERQLSLKMRQHVTPISTDNFAFALG